MMKRVIGFITILSVLCIASVQAQATDATQLFYKIRSKIVSVKDYTADVRMKIDVSFMRVPPMNGKLYFKSPDKMKLERKAGISILPKKDISLSLNNLIPDAGVTVIDAGFETIGTVKARVIKVIPDNESDIVLSKIWIDEAKQLALRTETTTRDNGTIKMEMEYGRYATYCLPDKMTIHLELKDYKMPKGLAMDYEDSDADMLEKAKKAKANKGKIQITYLEYKINTGLSDAIFKDRSR